MLSRRIKFLNKNVIVRMYISEGKFKSAASIRKEFLDYFLKDHSFVRSSPVMNLNDPSTPFVNAGMNQFKGVFLGHYDPPSLRVANSQKCIRVGGKHNDLEEVGSDTYHHTFFEMLGNWSFGDYFKEEACKYAWNLLTGPFGIKKDLLYVTYFGGDEKLGLEPDLECKNIWLRLGVPENRILAFGAKDNFWEMGSTGPCGLCTEIHISESPDEPLNLMELWNIVFIQNERVENGQIIKLPKHHVDTGMGFERLVAVLQRKKSNYDTDLFVPLFETIEKSSKVPKYEGKFGSDDKEGLDTAYRILADHSRMVTVALADGVLPDQNQKLRRVLRRALDVSEKTFRKTDLVNELSFRVAEMLGETYPELHRNLKQVQNIIRYEEEVLKALRETSGKKWEKMVKERSALSAVTDYMVSGLIPGYNDLQSILKDEEPKMETLPGEFALKLYDTYGLSKTTISELAKIESLKFEMSAFEENLKKTKERSRAKTKEKLYKEPVSKLSLDVLERFNVPRTDDSLKYDYSFDHKEYFFPPVRSKLLGLIINGNLKLSPEESDCILEKDDFLGREVNILLDKTPFYVKEGGQTFDKGYVQIKSLLFDIYEVRKIRGYVFHVGYVVNNKSRKLPVQQSKLSLKVGEDSQAWVNSRRRLSAMRHHTAAHLLNAALRKVLPAIGQRGSSVGKDKLSFECSLFGQKLTNERVVELEKVVNDCINSDAPVETKIVNMSRMMAEDNLTVIPGEIYPETGIRIVNIESPFLKSKEACCGTHVHRTGSLGHFCILYLKSQGAVSVDIHAAAGPVMRLAKIAGKNLKNRVERLEEEFKAKLTLCDELDSEIHDIQRNLMEKGDKILISYVDYRECQSRLSNLARAILLHRRTSARDGLETEIRKLQKCTTVPFIIHCMQSSDASINDVPLKKLEKLCPDLPILVIVFSKKCIRAKCCVPRKMVSNSFNALSWMDSIIKIFQSQADTPQGQDPLLVRNMKTSRLPWDEIEPLAIKACTKAKNFAVLALNVSKEKQANKTKN
ncbi:alanine--tRNA ligase, mitochondrial [Belonocnema kinseyi]|uniref:alanine--tRNA ligase, mitochondrial n=1 Tax=Belonocnema kinseyi TaxID=2817044 RepID=UPI00143DDCAF|nr:alanine--tRNA ligase, mitochondrial [Belonocnema kinseyi]